MKKCDDCEQPAVFRHIYEERTDHYCDRHSLRGLRRDLYHSEQRQKPMLDLIAVELVNDKEATAHAIA
jgi:hypothetical protein